MAITDVFFPQGDWLNIKANAPTRRDYNINAMADLASNLPSSLSVFYPAAASAISLPYDGIQALTRTTDKDFNQATTMGGLTAKEIAADALGTAFAREDPFTSLRDRTIGASKPLAEQLANFNLLNTLSNLAFTPAYGDIPSKEDRQGIESFNNLVTDTVMAEPQKGFEDYPGVENLGGVQNFDLEGVQDIISQMEEEKGNYIERPEDRFSMDGILQSLGGYAKDTAGRYIGSQALSGAGGMLFGPVGALVGGIAGLLGGGNLFNQPYMGAQSYTMDQYGNMYTAGQLNKMNALGGYYTEQARASRRRDQEIRNIIDRKNKGLRYGANRLAQLQKEKAAEDAARRSTSGTYLSGGGGDTFSFSDNSGYGGTGTASPSNVGPGGTLGGGV